MTAPLEDLEALDRTLQQILALLTQADQDLEQMLQAAADYQQAHGQHVSSAPMLHQAIRDIQVNVHSYTDQRNQIEGLIAQARSEAQQIPDNPY